MHLDVWPLELGIWIHNPHSHTRHSPHYMRCDFLHFLRKARQGVVPFAKIHPATTLPKPKSVCAQT